MHHPSDDDLAISTPMSRAHRVTVGVLSVVLFVELLFLLAKGQWLTAFLVATILLLTVLPVILGDKLPVHIPHTFQTLSIIFVFATLFLGEVHGFYERFWWWDMVLHAGSGLLLGIVGFLLVYILTENRRLRPRMHPLLIAFFAVCFAVTVGTLWEIYEFLMDQTFGTTMQKPEMRDGSPLTDTMYDLIVDTAGALVIGFYGWWHLSDGRRSFIERWTQRFIQTNPDLLDRK